jgi:cytochrome c551
MKKRLLSIAVGLFLLFGLAACGGSKDNGGGNESGGDGGTATASAEKLFEQKCSSCHGGDLKSGYAPDLDKIGSKYSKEEIEKIIEEGRGQMPKGLLQGDDASKVAEWLAQKK